MKNTKLYISMYHYTRDLKNSRYPSIKGLDVSLFRQQIDFFSNNFNVVTMEEVLDALEDKYELPEKAMLLTFDDGYIDNYTYAFPILNEYKMQGSFFIPGITFNEHKLMDVNKIHYILASADLESLLSDVLERMNYYREESETPYKSNDELFNEYAVASSLDIKEVIFIKRMLQTVLPERIRGLICDDLFEKYVGVTQYQLAHELYMTKDQIKTLKRNGMFIGIHGYDHYWLANLPEEKMKQDIDKALVTLDEFIDNKRWVMNYPYGDYSQTVIDYLSSKGACLGLTTDVGIADLSLNNKFLFPRFDCNDFPPKSESYLKY